MDAICFNTSECGGSVKWVRSPVVLMWRSTFENNVRRLQVLSTTAHKLSFIVPMADNDEAGPSGTGTLAVDPAVLAQADAKFEQGVQCIRVGAPALQCRRAVVVPPAAVPTRCRPTRRRPPAALPAEQRPRSGGAAVCRGPGGPSAALRR